MVGDTNRMSELNKLKISVTEGPIGFYSSGNIPNGPVVVLSYFLLGWDTPKLQKMNYFFIFFMYLYFLQEAVPLASRGSVFEGI